MSVEMTDERAKEIKQHIQFASLRRYPHLRAAAVARHYTSVMSIAMEMANVIKRAQGCTDENTLRLVDEYLVSMLHKIAEHHRADLGIQLSWPDYEEEDKPE